LKEYLVDFLVNIKNIKFKELIDQHFTIAIYRVNRLLGMLDSEFDQKYGKNSQIKAFFKEEIKFTQEKMSN